MHRDARVIRFFGAIAVCALAAGCGARAPLTPTSGAAGMTADASPGGGGGAAGSIGEGSEGGASGGEGALPGPAGTGGSGGTVSVGTGSAGAGPPAELDAGAAGTTAGDAAAPASPEVHEPGDAAGGIHGWINRTPDILPAQWPSGRRQPAVAYDRKKRRVVVYGGYGNAAPLQDTWEWDGAAGLWTRVAVQPPTMFDMAAAAYDEQDQSVMVFGGETFPGAAPSNDLWGYAAGWQKVGPTTVSAAWPPAQLDALLAYDVARARIVLVGSGATAATWEWDVAGRTWSHRATTVAPTNDAGVFAWDERRHVGVFFGNGAWGELWEWDGVAGTWTRKQVPGQVPAPRRLAAAAYDSDAGRVLLFAGSPDVDPPAIHSWTNDLWEWNGTSWTLLDSGPSGGAPDPREGHGLAYDSERHCLVTFGGSTPFAEPRDLWEWHR